MHYIFQHSRHRKDNESQRQEAILMNRTKKEKAEIKQAKLCKKFQIRNILQKNGQKFLRLHL